MARALLYPAVERGHERGYPAMSDAKISFHCPGCQALVSFPGDEAGTVQDCPECGGWVDVPELSRSPSLTDPHHEENARLFTERARQFEETARLIELSKSRHQEWKRQLEQSARYQDCAEEVFERFAALISRWEGLTTRFEKALAKLERTEN